MHGPRAPALHGVDGTALLTGLALGCSCAGFGNLTPHLGTMLFLAAASAAFLASAALEPAGLAGLAAGLPSANDNGLAELCFKD